MTIVEAIKRVFEERKISLTYKEIYTEIVRNNLYKFNAQIPEPVVNGTLRRHCVGLNFSYASPVKHFIVDSKQGSQTKYYLFEKNNIKNQKIDLNIINQTLSADKLPEEKIRDAYLEHRADLQAMLLVKILDSDPAFFERLVMNLLLAMGYGGNISNAGLVTGIPGDGGIDGVIKEDQLGLSKIYIQAKRYTDKNIGRPDIQQFVGAMENVHKGIFITTSSFTKAAKEYSAKQQKSLILIDGDTLCDLMLTHKVGVSIIQSYATFKIDGDYFADK